MFIRVLGEHLKRVGAGRYELTHRGRLVVVRKVRGGWVADRPGFRTAPAPSLHAAVVKLKEEGA